MKPIEIRDSEVDGSAVSRDIEEAAAAMRASGAYPKDLDRQLARPLRSPEEVVSDTATETRRYINKMARSWPALLDDPIASDKPVIGPVFEGVKWLIWKSLDWYVGQIVARVSTFNSLSVNATRDLDSRLLWTEKVIEEQKAKQADLDNRLKEIESKSTAVSRKDEKK